MIGKNLSIFFDDFSWTFCGTYSAMRTFVVINLSNIVFNVNCIVRAVLFTNLTGNASCRTCVTNVFTKYVRRALNSVL